MESPRTLISRSPVQMDGEQLLAPQTSSLGATISPICLQFPHSSSIPPEVYPHGFPTPPRLSTDRARSLDPLPGQPTHACV